MEIEIFLLQDRKEQAVSKDLTTGVGLDSSEHERSLCLPPSRDFLTEIITKISICVQYEITHR